MVINAFIQQKENNTMIRKEKEILIQKWEECFHKKVTEVLSESGMNKLFDNNTSITEAVIMLTIPAIVDALEDAEDEDAVRVVVIDNEDAKEGKFGVLRTTDESLCIKRFETKEEANDFIKEQALHTKYTIDEFKVVKVID